MIVFLILFFRYKKVEAYNIDPNHCDYWGVVVYGVIQSLQRKHYQTIFGIKTGGDFGDL